MSDWIVLKFVGMTPFVWHMRIVALCSLLPLLNCFLKVCLPKLIAAVLNLFAATILSSFWSTKSQQIITHTFCGRDKIFTENQNRVSPIIFASAANPRPSCRHLPLWNEFSTSLEATILYRLLGWKWVLMAFSHIKTTRVIPTETKGVFFTARVSSEFEY